MSEIEARLARRLAIAFWKGERAERIEVALFDAAPKLRPPQAGFQWEQADPLTTFDLKRFNAVRGYQAQQGREISRCLKELRQLRKEALAECTDEPEDMLENEPGSPRHPPTTTRPRRPKRPCGRLRNPRETNPSRRPPWRFWEVDGVPMLDVWGQPRGIRWLGLRARDLAPQALARAISRVICRPWPPDARRRVQAGHSPLCSSSPRRRALRNRRVKATPADHQPHASTATAWPNRAPSKRCSTSTARMPSKTGAEGRSQAIQRTAAGRVASG